jgi:hypothetical protein
MPGWRAQCSVSNPERKQYSAACGLERDTSWSRRRTGRCGIADAPVWSVYRHRPPQS